MTNHSILSDKPISGPDEDLFGVNGIAKSIAKSVLGIKNPVGQVIALNGAWGSGKTSLINLARHHLCNAVEEETLQIVDFRGWWFTGERAITQAFFGELQNAMRPGFSGTARSLLPKLGSQILKGGSVIGPAATLAGVPGIGALASGTLDWIGRGIDSSQSADKLHAKLASALAKGGKRYLVIIDDIDRLSSEEALAVFRLVKSIGHLPNVVYLLAFDNQIAINAVEERYPSEGVRYLEKIIQATFDVPEPPQYRLNQLADQALTKICGLVPQNEYVDVGNIFHSTIAPELTSPRDLIRYTNAISVTWPAVQGEVYLADFLGIEALRIFQPSVHKAAKTAAHLLFPVTGEQNQKERADLLDNWFLKNVNPDHRDRIKKSLMRLFPQLQGPWINTYHQNTDFTEARLRRICSKVHFNTYFRFELDPDVISQEEITELTRRAEDQDFIKQSLLAATHQKLPMGGTKVAALIEALKWNARAFRSDSVEPFLSALFEVADEITLEADEMSTVGSFGTEIRLYGLTYWCLESRFDLAERSAILRRVSTSAQPGWLSHLASSVLHHHFPEKDSSPAPQSQWLVNKVTAEELRDQALSRIRDAAQDGSLLQHREVTVLLHRWNRFENDGGQSVRAWTNAQLADNDAVIRFVEALTSMGESFSMGFGGLSDLVPHRHVTTQTGAINEIMDPELFRLRVKEVAGATATAPPDSETLKTFLDTWARSDEE